MSSVIQELANVLGSKPGSSWARPFAAGRALLRRWVFELRLHWSRMQRPRCRPALVIFPSSQPWSGSSNLRAWLVAPELERLGWRVVVVPEPLSLSQRMRILRLERPDVVLLQQTRHLLNQPRLYRPYPCVLDADDADYLDPRHHDRIVQCATDAAAIVGGSRYVTRLLAQHNAGPHHVLWTSTPRPARPPSTPPALREPIVAWAHERPLLFRHEADLIQAVMVEVCRRTGCTFWLFGTSESEAQAWLEPLRRAGGTCIAIPTMPYEAYLEKVAQVAVGLQPVCLDNDFSRGRSFGKILAYLAGQVAVVASDAVDHPLLFRDGANGFLVRENVDDWVKAIVPLVEDPALRSRVALAGWEDLHKRLTTDRFANLLNPILREIASTYPRGGSHRVGGSSPEGRPT